MVLLLRITTCMCLLYQLLDKSYAQNIQDIAVSNKNITASVPLCSDIHQCSESRSSLPACRCDDLCQLFDDCCFLTGKNQTSSVLELDTLNIFHGQIGCVIPGLDESSDLLDHGFFMVDKCAHLNFDSEIITKCHEPNITDVQSMIPVTENKHGVSYRNVYCALCNAVPVANIVWWQLQAQCDEDTLLGLQQGLDAGLSLADTLRIINELCPITFGSPGDFVSEVGTRPCYTELVDFNKCLPDTPDLILDRCKRYAAYVIDDQDAIYRNPDCYICAKGIDEELYEVVLDCEHEDTPMIYSRSDFGPSDGPDKPTEGRTYPPLTGPPPPPPATYPPLGGCCGPIGPGGGFPGFIGPGGPDIPTGGRTFPPIVRPPPATRGPPIPPATQIPPRGHVPISVIVDFSSDSGVLIEIKDTIITFDTITCEANEVYDPYTDKCQLLSCPDGYVLIEGHCVLMPSGEGTECDGNLVATVNATSSNCNDTTGSETDESKCLKRIFNRLDIQVISDSYKCVDPYLIEHTFVINSSVSVSDLEKSLDGIFLPLDDDDSSSSPIQTCDVNTFTLTLFCESDLFSCDERVVFSNVTIEKRNTSTIVSYDDTEFPFVRGNLSLQYGVGDSDDEFGKVISVEFCESKNISCSLIALNASLFIDYSNDVILYEPTGDLFTQDEYRYTMDGLIQVCSFLERNGTRNSTRTITFVAYDQSQVVLSIIGCVISMVALTITFLTYTIFSSLRTRATKAIMNLVVALFMAQMVFLLGAGYTENKELCSFIAVLSHYLWLCTFAWSTVLSFDLNITFSSKLIRTRQDRDAPIIRYLLYGWLAPFVIIVPCLVIFLCACTDITFYYGNEGACWIYDQYANLVVFGGPLVVCLIINCIFFTNTLWNIHKTKARTKKLKKERSALDNIKEELSIYVKIATLMGFTWIFAFSAAFTGVAALWFIYIIINSLQGLYIFFAFTFNKRVARYWKNKLTGKPVDYTNSTSSKTARSTQGSAGANHVNGVEQHELTYQTVNVTLTDDTEQSEQSDSKLYK